MSRDEKILLLELILRDLRGNWDCPDVRANYAYQLAEELGYMSVCVTIDDFNNAGWYKDGRIFRDDYDMLAKEYEIEATLVGRSDEFMHAYNNYITYPEYAL